MFQVTFKPIVISSNRRKDGTYPVKIRVTFKGVSRRLATTLVAHPKDLTRSLRIKNPDILNRANELVARMQGAIADLSFVIEEWDVDRVVDYIKKKLTGQTFRLDFFAWANEFLQSKSEATRKSYDSALNSFRRFTGEIDINSITHSLLVEYVSFLENEPVLKVRGGKVIETQKSKNVARRYVGKLSHIFQAAKMRFNSDDSTLIPRSPFNNLETPPEFPKGQRAIPDILQVMIHSDPCPATDLFIVSFCLMGANMADLYLAKPCEEVWIYNRQKTKDRRQDGAELRVRIPKEVRPYINRLQDGPKGWMLPALHRATKDTATKSENKALKEWAEANGVEPFTFYAARKTWATIARRVGVEKATIDECLAHKGDYQMADIYIERQWELLDKANERVMRYTFGDSAI